MRVVDLDRDMSDVIPLGLAAETLYLFERMERETLAALYANPGARVLDAAGGLGQDSRKLAARGVFAVCAEPSSRMSTLGRQIEDEKSGDSVSRVQWTRGWSESLPFAADSFHAAFCKGALDHFDDPEGSIRELARVTRPDGRVVLAVANFRSAACRVQQLLDRLAGGRAAPGRRPYHVPSDHFTRYDPALLREQVERHVIVEQWMGLSLFWGLESWGTLLQRVSEVNAQRLLRLADWMGGLFPSLADVIIVAGRPRS